MGDESKEHPGRFLKEAVRSKGISVKRAAELLGVGRPALSNLLNGKASLSPEMAARFERAFQIPAQNLIDRQSAYVAAAAKLGGAPTTAKRYVPPFLAIKASEIEAWSGAIAARSRFAVFLRALINSTGAGLSRVDFPGNDDAERPDWDGFVVASDGTPWVPLGRSGWEFGCNKDPEKKANQDYANRIAAIPEAERAEITFVFVTPQRWSGKKRWETERQAGGNWKHVIAFDGSDLEQWLEQSVAAQAWFAGETKRAARGAKSLDQCWAEWANVADPPLIGTLFRPAVERAKSGVSAKLAKSPHEPLIVCADSVEEGLAFLAQFFTSDSSDPLERDRVVVFQETGVLPSLAAGTSGFIAVATTRDVERELAAHSGSVPSIVIYPRNAANATADVMLEPLDDDTFRTGLELMGLSRDAIERRAHESGRSLTVLRRRLSTFPAVRTPQWASDTTTARQLVRFLFAGAWNAQNPHDQVVVSFLGPQVDYSMVEKDFQPLTALNDAPVWSIANHRGVVSKIDLLFAIAGTVTGPELENYFQVATLVLSEDDPSLDLPEKDRWAAGLYGKKRDISGALRDGISETLVLLAVHGNALFRDRLGVDVEARAAGLVKELLSPLTPRSLEAQERDLPTYAEAAPETFLKLLESDLKSQEPVALTLMRPVASNTFGRCVRAGLLWALENLAWSPRTLPRAVLVLGKLAGIKIDDNWTNKPIESLKAIFRAWMPQTAANLQERLDAMALLAEHHPHVAWEICTDQFGAYNQIGHYSHKPRWRNDGYGFGEPLADRHETIDFLVKIIDMALQWKRHDSHTLGDLVARLHALTPEHQKAVWSLIRDWAARASDADKAWVREKIRVSVLSRAARVRRGTREPDELTNNAKLTYEALEPRDVINRHEWLFRDGYVDESADELQDDANDFQKREARITGLRVDALARVRKERGFDGIFELAERGNAAVQIGWLMVSHVLSADEVADFVVAAQKDERTASTMPRKNLIFGALGALADGAPSLLRRIRPSLTPEAFARVLELAPFRRSTWVLVDELDDSAKHAYWRGVRPDWLRTADVDLNEAVERLINAKRPRAAFHCVHIGFKDLKPTVLYRLMSEIASGTGEESGKYQLEPYYIDLAFGLLDKSDAFSSEQMAVLEFHYIEALAGKWGASEPRGVPHLEKYVEEHPEMFVQAVAWVYKRTDEGTDPEDMRLTDPTHIQNRAERGYRLLGALKRIPGRNKQGDMDRDELVRWIGAVRSACSELGRQKVGDHSLGVLMSHAPVGRDGVWPCESVRDALERIQADDMSSGITMGLFNSRGAHWRGKGGDQEREMAEPYRKWMNALQFSHPFVVSSILKPMFDTYERHAEIHDSEDEIQRRIRH
jgi:plasmid maintenance system antidote protein VapI